MIQPRLVLLGMSRRRLLAPKHIRTPIKLIAIRNNTRIRIHRRIGLIHPLQQHILPIGNIARPRKLPVQNRIAPGRIPIPQKRNQTLPVQIHPLGQPHRLYHSRKIINRLHKLRRSCPMTKLGMPHNHRNPRNLIPEHPVLTRTPVIAIVRPVIRRENNHRIIHQPHILNLIEKMPHPAIHHRHLTRINRLHPLQLRLRQIAIHPIVRRNRILHHIVLRIIVQLHIVAWRIPWLVRIKRIDHQKKFPIRIVLKPPRRP